MKIFGALGSKDLLSCWNTLWVDWNEENFSCASLNFETPGITQLTQTDTIGPGICMFNKELLLNARILDLSRGFPRRTTWPSPWWPPWNGAAEAIFSRHTRC